MRNAARLSRLAHRGVRHAGPGPHTGPGRRRRARPGRPARAAHARGNRAPPAAIATARTAGHAGALGLPLRVRHLHVPHHPDRQAGGRCAGAGATRHRRLCGSVARTGHGGARHQRLRPA
ncbi:hypothetical protein G6F46_014844 [Rhizopus delemar]|nr:hypothetical protein G6F46_014844 [Rhizopus delemar]